MAALERKLNILILESSKVIAERLVDIIMELGEIEEILYAPTFDKPINLLLSNRVDIVLCSIALDDNNVAKLSELRKNCKPFSFIVLFNNIQPGYIHNCRDLPIDYLVNTSENLENVPDIIIQATLELDKRAELVLS
jgi:DNA-binding NarL/FixJ family response regulator